MTKSIPIPIVTDNTTSIHQIPHVNLSHLPNQPINHLSAHLNREKNPCRSPFTPQIVPRVEGKERNHVHERCESHRKRPEEQGLLRMEYHLPPYAWPDRIPQPKLSLSA